MTNASLMSLIIVDLKILAEIKKNLRNSAIHLRISAPKGSQWGEKYQGQVLRIRQTSTLCLCLNLSRTTRQSKGTVEQS